MIFMPRILARWHSPRKLQVSGAPVVPDTARSKLPKTGVVDTMQEKGLAPMKDEIRALADCYAAELGAAWTSALPRGSRMTARMF